MPSPNDLQQSSNGTMERPGRSPDLVAASGGRPALTGVWAGAREFLPAEAQLEMPVQPLDGIDCFADGRTAPLRRAAPTIGRRRLFMVAGSVALGVLAVHQMRSALSIDGIDTLDWLFLGLFFSLFTWISFGFLGSVAGFAALAGTEVRDQSSRLRLPKRPVAVLLTICNENLDAVSGRLNAMTGSVAAIGAARLFDFFVLSDSGAKAEGAELAVFRRVRDASAARVFYRRRAINEARKPGNIADWVRRFGRSYDAMIVLDADSLMSGEAMSRLAVSMEDRPELGLLQTIPTIIHGHTFFARWHQFAAAAYGHIASAGL